MKQFSSVLAAILCSAAAGMAHAAEITTGGAYVLRQNIGANTVGVTSGDVLDVVAVNVNPNLTTSGFTTNPQLPGSYSLVNLFTSSAGFGSRTFDALIPGIGGTVTAPWTVYLQNRTDTLTLTTNSLAGVQALPLLSNLTVSGSTLAPVLSWDPVVTSTPYSNVLLRIYDNRTNQLIVNDQLIGGAGTTSHTVAQGMLAPNGDYTFRVILEDRPGGVSLNRSSTFVNHMATSAAVSSGALSVATGGTLSPLTLSTGANSHPSSSILIGLNGPGSATLQNGTTLTGTFAGVGQNNYGTLNVNNTTVTLNGGTVVDPVQTTTNGGFLTVGRLSGGRGFVDVFNGGRIDINSGGFLQPGMNIGREAGSFGNVNVNGTGSTIAITGPAAVSPTASDNGLIQVGRGGDGRLNITGGGQVLNAAAGVTNIGVLAGSRGSVLVSGSGSLLDAGQYLNVGSSSGGEGLLRIQSGGLVRADAVTVRANGYLTGSGGTLEGALTIAGGAFLPGSSPGKMTIIGDLFLTEGLLLLEANGDGPGEIDEVDVTGEIVIGPNMTIEIMLGYAPTAPLVFLSAGDGITIDENFAGPKVFALLGSGVQEGTTVRIAIGDEVFDVIVQAPVPAPATLALLAVGIVGLVAARRRKVLH